MARIVWLELPKVSQESSQELISWLSQFQRNIITFSTTVGQYDVLHAPPEKPRHGLVVYADGTNWNPGSGEGLYRFSSIATWVFLG